MKQEKTNDFAIGKAYVVQWVDSCGTPAGWIDLSDYDYPTDVMEITTYGTVINKSGNAKYFTVWMTLRNAKAYRRKKKEGEIDREDDGQGDTYNSQQV